MRRLVLGTLLAATAVVSIVSLIALKHEEATRAPVVVVVVEQRDRMIPQKHQQQQQQEIDDRLYREPPPEEENKNNFDISSGCEGGIVALTYASHAGRDDRFCRSLESAIWNGVGLRVLGWGVEWEGLSQKLAAALEAVAALPDDCVVLFSDAYDVLYADTLETILAAFRNLGKPLVFSAECGCWPQVMRDRGKTCRDAYPRSPTPYRYLNSGGWIGEAKVAERFLRRLVDGAGQKGKKFHALNDQELASEMYFRGDPDLSLDHYATIFQPMHAVNDATAVPNCDPWPRLRRRRDGRVFNGETGSRPAVYHFNGGGKAHHLDLERSMWWHVCPEARDFFSKLEKSVLLFDHKPRAFDDVCPGHIAQRRRHPSSISPAQQQCPDFPTTPFTAKGGGDGGGGERPDD